MPENNYEARILRMEDSITALSQQTAELAAQYEFLGRQIAMLPESLSEQLSSFSKVLDDKIATIVDSQKGHTGGLELTRKLIDENQKRVEELERIEQFRRERISFWKKMIFGVVTAGLGASVSALFDYLAKRH